MIERVSTRRCHDTFWFFKVGAAKKCVRCKTDEKGLQSWLMHTTVHTFLSPAMASTWYAKR